MAVNGFDDAKNKVSVYTTVEVDTNKQSKHTTAEITLYAASWSSNRQTVTLTGVTADDTVIVGPAFSAVENSYFKCNVHCLGQSADSLTFRCSTTPTDDIPVNVVILGA